MSGGAVQPLWAAAELLVGFVIVMFTLALLWGLTALMARVVARLEQLRSATPPHAPPTPPATSGAGIADAVVADAGIAEAGIGDADIGDGELAAVAAAVALMLDRPHRVVRVRPQPSAWGQQGRRDAHASHRMP